NLGSGVRVTRSASHNVIGGTAVGGSGNTIAFNHGDGVFLDSGKGNLVSGDAVFANLGLGIRLNPTTLANNRQPAPVLTSLAVDADAQSLTIKLTIPAPLGGPVVS